MAHQVITVAQQKGGAGKTTVTAHLAVALSQRGFRVAVIDIDPQGTLARWHALREERFGAGYTGLTFATISGWRVDGEINRLKREHDFIVIDSPPHAETDAKVAIRAADLVVVPVQPSPADLWATETTLKLAAAEKIPAYVVLNRVLPNSKLAQMALEVLGEEHVLEATLGNRVLFASTFLEGRTTTESAPTHQAAQEVKAVTEELLKYLVPMPAEEAATKEKPRAKKKLAKA